jgi:hypothetical protein
MISQLQYEEVNAAHAKTQAENDLNIRYFVGESTIARMFFYLFFLSMGFLYNTVFVSIFFCLQNRDFYTGKLVILHSISFLCCCYIFQMLSC